jgi:hypothetical protein
MMYQLARDLWLEALDYDEKATVHPDNHVGCTAVANTKRDSALRVLRAMGMPTAHGRAALEAAEAEEREEMRRVEAFDARTREVEVQRKADDR